MILGITVKNEINYRCIIISTRCLWNGVVPIYFRYWNNLYWQLSKSFYPISVRCVWEFITINPDNLETGKELATHRDVSAESIFFVWVSMHGLINTLMPRQDGRHLPDDIFKCIFMKENIWISIKISLKFVPKDPINNIPALVQVMAWRRPGDKPLSERMMVSLLTHICVTRPQWVKMLLTLALLWVSKYICIVDLWYGVIHN